MARKHTCPEPEKDSSTRWLGTYGDMVTLLMAFFVMLFAVSETDNQKFEAFVAGLAGPFDNPAVDLGIVEGASLQSGDSSPLSLVAPVTVGQAQRVSNSEVELDAEEEAEAEEAARAEQLEEVEQELEQALAAEELPITADIRDDERGLVVAISTDDVLFATGSAALSQAGREIIATLAPVLVEAPNTLVVEGHTDDRPLDQGGYTNWNLSTDRAVAVVQLLGDEHGLSYGRISAAGYADNRPLVPNTSDANRSINRRVEILIVGLPPAELDLPEPAEGEAPAGPADEGPPAAHTPPVPGPIDPAPPPVEGPLQGLAAGAERSDATRGSPLARIIAVE